MSTKAPMPLNPLHALQQWYDEQCDGQWEHGFGIRIESLDNPGWLMTIDLADTKLSHQAFEAVENDEGSQWIRCHRTEGQFIAAGSPWMLEKMVKTFLDWARP